eukprot:TRINITY_DN3008_c0_g1_i1.p1 TRINITY_DN3008_c0_g1~~TRINITY_DN3008_c0_g1_i1.p1  ORF type:complete len:173 (+),score=60.89 TRINITY_DN3008_c0_g1_i1:98-616(+)
MESFLNFNLNGGGEVVETTHGPSASGEREAESGRRKTKRQMEASKVFWKQRLEQLEKMEDENVKRAQNEKDSPSSSLLFSGLTFYFEGYTDDHSSLALKELVNALGGKSILLLQDHPRDLHFSLRCKATETVGVEEGGEGEGRRKGKGKESEKCFVHFHELRREKRTPGGAS